MDGQRPEPVLDEARLIRLLGMVLAAVVVVLGLFGVVVSEELAGRISTAITVAVGAGVAVWSYVAPMWRARRLRAQVTPVSDPQAADGTPLVPASTAAEPAEQRSRLDDAVAAQEQVAAATTAGTPVEPVQDDLDLWNDDYETVKELAS